MASERDDVLAERATLKWMLKAEGQVHAQEPLEKRARELLQHAIIVS